MNSKPKTIIAYATTHPIKSAVLSVFALFTIIGGGFGAFYAVVPDSVEALIVGPPCCDGGGFPPETPEPILDPGFPGFGGGGGGGGIPIPPIVPYCELAVTPGSIATGSTAQLTWSTRNAVTATIDQGIASVSVPNGSRTVTPATNTTYTMIATSSTGMEVICSSSVTVTPIVVTPAPVCTLDINPSTITLGGSAQIVWTTTNGNTFHIGGGIGSVTPVVGGTTSVTPGALGTYTYVGVVTNSAGATATCSDTVTVVPPVVVNAPVCTLDIDKSNIVLGESATISWTTRNGDSFVINNGVGAQTLSTTPNAGGTNSITPSATGVITYTGTVTSVSGATATCSDSITVTPPVVGTAPVCTLAADDTTLLSGQETALRWTTEYATEVELEYLGTTTSGLALNGFTNVSGVGTYTLTARDADGDTVTCTEEITRTTVVPNLACTLTIDKTTMRSGESAEMSWTTTGASSFGINGNTKALNGTETISPAGVQTYTYTGTATNSAGDTVTCSDTIQVTGGSGGGGLACVLDIDRSSMRSGESATMSWSTTDAVSFKINGADKALTGTETISPAGVQTYTYTGTATNSAGDTVTCSDTIQVTGGSGGGGLACSMTFTKSSIRSGESSELRWTTRSADSAEINNDIGSVVLNGDTTISKTGVGTYEYVLTARKESDTAICRATLVVSGGSGCTSNCGGGSSNPNITIDFLKKVGEQPLAFITLSQIPYTGLELGPIGTVIYWLSLTIWSGAIAYLVLFKFLPYTGRKLVAIGNGVSEVLDSTQEGTIDVTMHQELEDTHVEGFIPKSGDEVLSVEDIVRGLSRMHQNPRPTPAPIVEEVAEEEFEMDEVDVAKEMELPPVQEEVKSASSGDDLRLLSALAAGDRDTSFSLLRRAAKNGSSAEALIEKALVHLDAAYRARIDGTLCSDDVRRIASAFDTALLEEVISALASAIDTTYSQSQIGAKLAIARAHAVIERG